MYNFLKNSHSGLAYLVLLGLLISTFYYFAQVRSKEKITKQKRTIALVTMILVHTQFVLGILLYFVSPIVKQALSDFGSAMGDSNLRLYSLEHPMVMLIVVVLVTLAHRSVKNAMLHNRKLSNLAPVFFLFSLLLAASRIPWSTWLPF